MNATDTLITTALAHVSTDLVRDYEGAPLTTIAFPISGDDLARAKAATVPPATPPADTYEQDDVFGGYGQGFTTSLIMAALADK